MPIISTTQRQSTFTWGALLTLCTFIATRTDGFAPRTSNVISPNKHQISSPHSKITSLSPTTSSTASTTIQSSSSTTTPTSTSTTSLNASNKNEINPLRPGSICALVTPFLPNGSIDVPSLRSILQFHVSSGTDGLCVLGTTGEASLMTMAERQLVLDVVVEEVKGLIPILVGTGSINPLDVEAMTRQAIDTGCDASLVVTPPYIKPPQRGLVTHFVKFAEMGLPVVVYNVPGRTGVDFSPESIGECMKESEFIIGVKEATGDVGRVRAIQDVVAKVNQETGTGSGDRSLLLYSGDDSTEAEFVLQGGSGCISVTANVAPKKMATMMKLALEGKRDEAMKINAELDAIHSNIFVESNPIPAKWALKRMGMIESAHCRPPLVELDEKHYSLIEESLKLGGCL